MYNVHDAITSILTAYKHTVLYNARWTGYWCTENLVLLQLIKKTKIRTSASLYL